MFKDFKQVAYLQEMFGPIKPIFNNLYQARKVSSHVFVLLGVSILSFSSIFDPTVWDFLFSILLHMHDHYTKEIQQLH